MFIWYIWLVQLVFLWTDNFCRMLPLQRVSDARWQNFAKRRIKNKPKQCSLFENASSVYKSFHSHTENIREQIETSEFFVLLFCFQLPMILEDSARVCYRSIVLTFTLRWARACLQFCSYNACLYLNSLLAAAIS